MSAHAWPTAATRLVVLLGWPARYSLSPQIQNAAFREGGHDLVYVAMPCRADDLDTLVAALVATGAVGANVTVPHKTRAAELCDVVSDEAALIGAVNTLTFTASGIHGDNTDAAGLADAWRDSGAIGDGASVTLLGTGGAARAAAVAAGRFGAVVRVVGRRRDAAARAAEIALRAGAVTAEPIELDEEASLVVAVGAADLVVNATPLGMAGEELPGPFMALRADQVAYDLVYEPPVTPFLAAAERAGAVGHHGLGMLVAQAARAYERWTGDRAPHDVMSAVAVAALAERVTGT